MSNRSLELDLSKGILIALMVMFHLGHFHENYPLVTDCVYSFHMSGFLLISGYLFSVNKGTKHFLKGVRRIVVPYLVFEIFYLLGLSIIGKYLGASNTFGGSFTEYLNCIFLQPIGTYWYLHTMLFCMVCYFLVIKAKLRGLSAIVVAGIVLFAITLIIDGLKWENVMYFLIGASFRSFELKITDRLSSLFSILGFAVIAFFADEFSRFSIVGLGLTFCSLSFMFAITKFLPKKVVDSVSYVGRNSLAIVLFSPIFAIASKFFIPIFKFDHSAIIWMMFSVTFIISFSLFSAWVLDVMRISKIMMGKNLYAEYNVNS